MILVVKVKESGDGHLDIVTSPYHIVKIPKKNVARVVFKKVTSVQNDTTYLEGTVWLLTSLSGKRAIKGSTITISFAKGTVTGSAGCNSYSGGYTATRDGTLMIPEIASTEEYCQKPKGIMQQEARYLDTLRSIKTYDRKEKQLTLYAENGRMLVYQAKSG